jgi:hypothetical protein
MHCDLSLVGQGRHSLLSKLQSFDFLDSNTLQKRNEIDFLTSLDSSNIDFQVRLAHSQTKKGLALCEDNLWKKDIKASNNLIHRALKTEFCE